MGNQAKFSGTCGGCLHWSPTDRTLDKGRELFGTCHRPAAYELEERNAMRAAHYQEADYLKLMRERMKNEGFMLQLVGDIIEGDARPYLRTGPNEFCSRHEARVKVPGPSLTATSAAN